MRRLIPLLDISEWSLAERDFNPSDLRAAQRTLYRLLTAVPFTSSLRDTATPVVSLFCRVIVRHEYSSHRVIRYTFLLARRIYMDPSV